MQSFSEKRLRSLERSLTQHNMRGIARRRFSEKHIIVILSLNIYYSIRQIGEGSFNHQLISLVVRICQYYVERSRNSLSIAFVNF